MSFQGLFVPDPIRHAVGDAAWLQRMLDAERALAAAEAEAGLLPATASAAIAEACRAELFDVERIAAEGRSVGNPAEPLVRALREQVGGDAAGFVHFGATSQDIVDTAAMLVAREARTLILDELDGVAAACAELTDAHRATAMAARTLLQQAVPTTFGLKAAGWLVAVVEARRRLAAVVLPAQLGGAGGTLAAFGAAGPDVRRRFAAQLGLAESVLPWHVHRGPVAELAAALDALTAACGKIGLDVVLLAQTEVAEVAEGTGGGSSTMPHKQNPARAVLARSCARIVHTNASLLTSGDYEHERAAGAWQAEWPALSTALAFAGGAAAAAHECLDALEVRPERMRENMTEALFSERDAFVERGLAEPSEEYVGRAEEFVEQALARYREELG